MVQGIEIDFSFLLNILFFLIFIIKEKWRYIFRARKKASTLRKFSAAPSHPVDYIETITAEEKRKLSPFYEVHPFLTHGKPSAVPLLHVTCTPGCTQRRIFAKDVEKAVEHEQSFFHTCFHVRKLVNEHVVEIYMPAT